MKNNAMPIATKLAKKSITTVTKLTQKSNASEAKEDANLARLIDEALKNGNGLADKNEVYKFLGRI